MSPEQLIREYVAASQASLDTANLPDKPAMGTEAYRVWSRDVYGPVYERWQAAREALHTWVAAHPVTGNRCEHCPSVGPCSVCARAA